MMVLFFFFFSFSPFSTLSETLFSGHGLFFVTHISDWHKQGEARRVGVFFFSSTLLRAMGNDDGRRVGTGEKNLLSLSLRPFLFCRRAWLLLAGVYV
jgi:hypothetical protein